MFEKFGDPRPGLYGRPMAHQLKGFKAPSLTEDTAPKFGESHKDSGKSKYKQQ